MRFSSLDSLLPSETLRFGGSAVLDADGRLAGMFTTQDLQTANGATVYCPA